MFIENQKIKNQEEMKNFAINFAKKMENNNFIIAIKGEIGAGKTFFCNHFINHFLEKKQEILSPTFNLVYNYETKIGEIYHFDLYRLKSSSELENIGFFEAIENNNCLIEWPEIADEFLQKLPKEKIFFMKILTENENKRTINFYGIGR